MGNKSLPSFISHKVTTHSRSAQRIKEILESRTDRISVQISENIPAGEQWEHWLTQKIGGSKLMIVLLPEAGRSLTWIRREIKLFESKCPDGRLIILKPSTLKTPSFLAKKQVINLDVEQIQKHFLKPLYYQDDFTKLGTSLNPRIARAEIARDAKELELAVRGLINPKTYRYGESLVVTIDDAKELRESRIIPDSATVDAPNRCEDILNWTLKSFTWAELRHHAEIDIGKGTFWITEMQEVMADIANDQPPRAMTSTFRGRGANVAGKIYGPQLHHVTLVEEAPVQYHFDFYEVLVPELVRGPGRIGKVFNLLHVASRVRWEVLNPYLKLQNREGELALSEQEKAEMIGKVIGSFRVIETEAERHNIFDPSNIDDVFEGEERALLYRMIEDRKAIKQRILCAREPKDFPALMTELELGLALNVKATVLLAERFLQLASGDKEDVERLVAKLSNQN